MSANRAFVPRPWPLSRIARRIVTPLGPGLQGPERLVVLSAGLADRGAHHHLEDLVIAEAGCFHSGYVLVGDPVGVFGDLIDQLFQRRGKLCVVEGGTALDARRLSLSFEDPRDQCCAPLCDIRHGFSPPLSCSCTGGAGERLEEATPVAVGLKDTTHLIASRPVEVQTAMLKLDARTVGAVGDEAQLDFCLQGRVVLPVGGDLPVKHQARMRLPQGYTAPITRASVVTALV